MFGSESKGLWPFYGWFRGCVPESTLFPYLSPCHSWPGPDDFGTKSVSSPVCLVSLLFNPRAGCFLSTISCAGCHFNRFGAYYAGVFFGGGARELRNLRLVCVFGRGTATYNLLLVADTVFQAGPGQVGIIGALGFQEPNSLRSDVFKYTVEAVSEWVLRVFKCEMLRRPVLVMPICIRRRQTSSQKLKSSVKHSASHMLRVHWRICCHIQQVQCLLYGNLQAETWWCSMMWYSKRGNEEG